MKRLFVCFSNDGNPYRNLALEKHLCQSVRESEGILYLWVNEPTVVIGRHQSVIAECNVLKAAADGVHIARRLTGGGAVFHDERNLNFSFISKKDDYDKKKNFEVLTRALAQYDIICEADGRNDLSVCGKKFSGNAFYVGEYALHHGTLMLEVDLLRLQNYLTVNPLKLSKKGVSSARSRVINLRSLNCDVTLDGMKEALVKAYGEVFGGKPEIINSCVSSDEVDAFSSKIFIYGDEGVIVKERMTDDGIFALARTKSGYKVYSDALDVEFVEEINKKLAAGEALTALNTIHTVAVKAVEEMLKEVKE